MVAAVYIISYSILKNIKDCVQDPNPYRNGQHAWWKGKLEMWIVNCLNGYKKNSLCKWYSHSDECVQIGNAGILCINNDLYKEKNAFLRAYCDVMQKRDASSYNSFKGRTVHQ